FVRSGLDQSGVTFRLADAARGKAIYDGKGGCAACHLVAGVGARTAPDLTDIGFIRRPGQIVTSLTDPDKATQPINRPITIITKDGRTITGRRYDEDTFTVQLIDSQERMLSIQKADIRQYDVGQHSPMPSFRGKLSDDELADLLAYLVSLKG
ncbi:MAG TPA: c-type cytochrome, partial [Rhizomicrobium sp.]